MKNALSAIMLVLLLATVAAGQSLSTRSPAPDSKGRDTIGAMFAPGVSMTGAQNSPGTYDNLNNKCWGNIFVLRGSGEWFSSYLTITMDYVEGLPNFEKGNSVVYGNWTMVVFKNDNYFATYFGEITEGYATWSVNPKTGFIDKRNTSAVLRLTGSLDGPIRFVDDPLIMRLDADTRLDGNLAVTTAILDADY